MPEAPRLPAHIFELLFDRAVDAFLLHRRGELLLVNQAACDSLGYTRDELMQLRIQDIEVEIDQDALSALWKRQEADPEVRGTLYGKHRRKDGSIFPVEVHSSRVQVDGEWLSWALVRDITRRRAMEAALAENARQLETALQRTRTILDHMDDALIAVTPDHALDVWNPAFVRMYAPDIAGTSPRIHDVLRPDLVALVEQSMEERAVLRAEVGLPDGGVGAAAASTMATGSGEVLGTVVLVRDVTHQREVERMKSEFTQMVTHELRTPMTSVLGFAKVTRKRLGALLDHVPDDDPKAQRAARQATDNLDIIIEEGQRLTALINDVLDFAKMEAGHLDLELGPVRAEHLVEQAVMRTDALFHGSPVELRTQVAEGLPELQVDRDRILQVLLNLLSNAQKFTDRGTVTVRVEPTGSSVRFSVTDTGCGIPANQIDGVFEKFRQVKRQGGGGTGLGLAICREIIQMHAGRIWVDSTEGEGSTFAFEVPAETAAI